MGLRWKGRELRGMNRKKRIISVQQSMQHGNYESITRTHSLHTYDRMDWISRIFCNRANCDTSFVIRNSNGWMNTKK
jgi:hypothetical protein